MTGDFSHIALSYVVAFYSDGADEPPIVDLLRRYAGYSAGILDRTMFVVVDDGSSATIAIPDDLDLNLRVFRVEDDIPWNQPGARNLGVTHAASDKVVMTDVDHYLGPDTFAHMIERRNPGRTMYKMRRETDEGEWLKPHPNTFFFSRARFLRFHGYDEEFCGHYGFDDSMFWRWQRYHGTRFLYLPSCCRAVSRTAKVSLGFHSLERQMSRNAELAARKRELWREVGPNAGHSRRFLSFTWRLELECFRSTVPPRPPRNRRWIRTWWWRWLMPAGMAG